MKTPKKWVDDVTPETLAVDAAQAILAPRVNAMRAYFKLAHEKPDNVEAVHQLRVWTRRAVAALKFFAGVVPEKEAAWWRKRLKAIRKAAGDARDDDVLLERLANEGVENDSPLIAALRKHRRKAEKPIHKAYKKLIVTKKLKRRFKKTSKRIVTANRDRHAAFAEWADERLLQARDHFFCAAERRGDSPEELHQFRIAGKELRYTMELAAALYPAPFRDKLYPQIEALQERLGELNDHAVARERFEKWRDKKKHHADDEARLVAWIYQESDQLAAAQNDFIAWWTAARRDELRAAFDAFLIPSG